MRFALQSPQSYSHAPMQRYKTTFEEIAMCAEFFCGRPVKTPERYIALRQVGLQTLKAAVVYCY